MAQTPPSVPRWKSIIRAVRFVANPIGILQENTRRYGRTYFFHIGGIQKGIMTTDPSVIKHILQKNHRNYKKSDIQTRVLGRFVGRGLLTSEGDYWLRQRRLIQPGFHRERLSNLVSLIVDEVEKHIKSNVESLYGDAEEFNVSKAMHRLSFQIIARTLFGDAIKPSDVDDLSAKIAKIQAFVVRQIRQPYLRGWFKVSGQLGKHDQIAGEVQHTLLAIIQERKKCETTSDDLLQMLLDARYEDTGLPMDTQQVLEESLILFIAGHETTSNALAWTLYLLSHHPHWQQEAYNEVRKKGDGFNPEDFRQPSLIQAILNESMRLYPPAWIIDRISKGDDEVDELLIPAGTRIFIDLYGLHHDSDLWENSMQFDPGRFLLKPPHKYNGFMPFGGGPRLCIGQHFSMMEMQIVISKILMRYEILPSSSNVELKPLVTLGSRTDIQVRLKKRMTS